MAAPRPNPFMPQYGMGSEEPSYEDNFWNNRSDTESLRQQAQNAARHYAGFDPSESGPGLGLPPAPKAPNYLDENGNLADRFTVKAGGPVSMSSNMDELKARLGGINLNTQGLEAIRGRALGQGDSPWAKLMLENQGVEEAGARDQTAQRTGSAYNAAASDAAARGGLTRGAAERMGTQGARATASGLQNVARGGQEQRLGIRTNDEQTKNEFLSRLPAMEQQALEPEFRKTSAWSDLANQEQTRGTNLGLANRDYQTKVDTGNVGNALSAQQDTTRFGLDRWGEMMKAYGADKTARAIEGAGKK